MKLLLSTLLSCLLFSLDVAAHGPTPQKAKESITISAPVEKVWGQVKQFDDIASWHTDVKASSGDGKLASGGVRSITFQNGEQLLEELDYYNDQEHEYSYRLKTENVKALPVSSYSIELLVKPAETAGSSVVLLKSRFYRGDTGNTPPESLSDAAAVEAMNKFFKNGLAGLKQTLEK
ncbi:MAG: SRPBCC family protein [Methylococcales bacterium]